MATEVGINVEPDHEVIDLDLPHDPQVQADLEARLRPVVQVAQATGPVDTGEYVSKIHLVERADDDGTRHVDADAEHSIYVEFGTRQTDRTGRRIHLPHHTLGNALDAAGGDH